MPIVKHDCKKKDSPAYKFQSERYGKGWVVANWLRDRRSVRCTICGEVINNPIVKKEKVRR